MGDGIKKWFMLQMWRVQQIAQVLSLVMLAITNALLLYGYMEWREGSYFSTPYIGIPIILLVIGGAIWIAAFIWDMKMKMWREQATVLVERNPYNKEKMSPKEIMIYGLIWLPVMDRLGKDDPKLVEAAAALRAWMAKASKEDVSTIHDLEATLKYIGIEDTNLIELNK